MLTDRCCFLLVEIPLSDLQNLVDRGTASKGQAFIRIADVSAAVQQKLLALVRDSGKGPVVAVLESGDEAGSNPKAKLLWKAAQQMMSPIAPALVLWADERADMHILISKQGIENLAGFVGGVLGGDGAIAAEGGIGK
jgi:hypothetical protein